MTEQQHPSPENAVWNFAKAILHGDDEHRAWLLEAAVAFEAGEPIPAPKGSGIRAQQMRDQAAWLVEINERFGPVYFQFVHDDDWTKDHDKAAHFSRKEDAERVIEHYGWTSAKAVEHMWPALTSPDERSEFTKPFHEAPQAHTKGTRPRAAGGNTYRYYATGLPAGAASRQGRAANDEADYFTCMKCGIREHIELLDAKAPLGHHDPDNANFDQFECIACYGPGWGTSIGAEKMQGLSVAPQLLPLYLKYFQAASGTLSSPGCKS